MSNETENSYHGIALSMTEMSTLKDVEELLQELGYLEEGEPIPVVLKDKLGLQERSIGVSVENNAVVALSVRDCALPFYWITCD